MDNGNRFFVWFLVLVIVVGNQPAVNLIRTIIIIIISCNWKSIPRTPDTMIERLNWLNRRSFLLVYLELICIPMCRFDVVRFFLFSFLEQRCADWMMKPNADESTWPWAFLLSFFLSLPATFTAGWRLPHEAARRYVVCRHSVYLTATAAKKGNSSSSSSSNSSNR